MNTIKIDKPVIKGSIDFSNDKASNIEIKAESIQYEYGEDFNFNEAELARSEKQLVQLMGISRKARKAYEILKKITVDEIKGLRADIVRDKIQEAEKLIQEIKDIDVFKTGMNAGLEDIEEITKENTKQ